MIHVFLPYLRQGWKIATLFALIITIATAAVVAAPKIQQNLFEAETAHEIAELAGISRALIAEEPTSYQGRGLPTLPLSEEFAPTGEITFPSALAPMVGDAQVSVESREPAAFTTGAALPTELKDRRLAIILDTGALDRVEFVRGAPPAPNSLEVEAREAEDSRELERMMLEDPEPIEVAISAANSRVLGLDVGDELEIHDFFYTTTVRVSGVFEPVEGSELAWQVHLRALTPFIDDDPNVGKTALGAALAHPDTPGWLGRIGAEQVAKVRFPITPEAVDSDGLAAALKEFTSDRYTIAEDLPPVEFTSRLAETMSDLLAQRDAAATVLATVLAGPVGAALAVSALVALISRQRRGASHALLRARGASGSQVRRLGAAEGILIGIPAAAVGIALGAPLTAGAMALVPALALALAPLPQFPSGARRGKPRWFAVGAVAIIALSAASVYAGREGGGYDPLTLALPLLLSASAAILLLAALPSLMRLLHRLMARRPGLVPFLGSARATREPHVGWPILTLIVALGAAMFSSTVLATINEGARANAYSAVGADVRLNTGWLSEEEQGELSALPGVEAATAIYRLDSAHVGGPSEHQRVTVFAADTAALARAQANLAEAQDLSVLAEADPGKIPAIVSDNLDLEEESGAALHLGSWLPLDVRGELSAIPGVAEAGRWIIVDVGSLPQEALAELTLPRLMLFATDGEQSTADAIGELGGGVVTTPVAALTKFTESPVIDGLRGLAQAALIFSALLAGVGALLFLALAAPERGYVTGILRTLGARVGGGLTAWEVGPVVAAGLLGGIGVGLALPHLVTFDWAAFTGGSTAPVIVVDVARTALAVALVGGVAAAGVAAAALAGGRRMQRALRIGE